MTDSYSLDSRCAQLLELLLNAEGFTSSALLIKESGLSRRTFYYDLARIEDWLKAEGFKPLLRDRVKGIAVSGDETKSIRSHLNGQKKEIAIFTPLERERLIICAIVLGYQPLFMEDFMELCDVSRNTIAADLKAVASFLSKSGLKLRYAAKEGYRIRGDRVHAFALLSLYYPSFRDYFIEHVFSDETSAAIREIFLRLKMIETELACDYVSGLLPSLAALLNSLSLWRLAQGKDETILKLEDKDALSIQSTREYDRVAEHFPDFCQEDRLYITLLLLGSRLQNMPVFSQENDGSARELAEQLARSFEEITGIACSENRELLTSLSAHIRTAWYRYRFGIQIGNPLLEDIRTQYRELFELTKAAFLRISDAYAFHISDAEIAYLALHFGTVMTPKEDHPTLRILILCPNGVAASNMIRQEVMRLVPQADEIAVAPIQALHEKDKWDIILSTDKLNDIDEYIHINPVLSDLDRITILRACMNYTPAAKAQKEDIIAIAKRYVPQESLPLFSRDMDAYFARMNETALVKTWYGAGLVHYLSLSHIRIVEQPADWETAIRFACAPLLFEDSVNEHYVEAIIEAQKERQQHMFLTDSLVLAHARPEDGVKQIDTALTVFRHPVRFGNGKDASVIIALAAKDETGHIQILNDILTLFSDSSTFDDLAQMKTPAQLRMYVQKKLSDNPDSH